MRTPGRRPFAAGEPERAARFSSGGVGPIGLPSRNRRKSSASVRRSDSDCRALFSRHLRQIVSRSRDDERATGRRHGFLIAHLRQRVQDARAAKRRPVSSSYRTAPSE